MAKLPRVHQKIFAENAVAKEIGQFGSAVAGAKKETGDIAEIQALEAWEKGWSEATVSKNRYPAMQERNGIDKVITQQLAYMFQEGIPEWNAETEYSSTGLVKSLDGNKIKLYRSLKDGNVGHLVSEPNWWEEVNLGGSGLEVCDIGMSLFVDETKGLRRWLNGQIVAINQNTQGFLTRLKKIVALYPSLLTTEENWQAAKTLSAFGQVGKFVFNYSGDDIVSVRIPAIVNVQGLFDLQNLGMTVEAGLPDLTLYTTQQNNRNSVGYAKAGTTYVENISYLASSQNPIYGNNTTVQEEAIQYPYYIQIATGQETEVNITNEIELNNPFFFGMSNYFKFKPNNLSWLKSAGYDEPKAAHPDYYNWILENVNKGVKGFKGQEGYCFIATDSSGYYWWVSTESPVVGASVYRYDAGVNSMFFDGTVETLTSNGFTFTSIFESSSHTVTRDSSKDTSILHPTAWITDNDFEINTSDETFRLPLKNGTEGMFGGGAVVGNGYGLGLTPDGSNLFMLSKYGGDGNDTNSRPSGPHSAPVPVGGSARAMGGSYVNIAWGVHPDPAKSGLVVANAGVVPDGWALYYYVGETVQNANLIDAGRMQEQITNINASSRGYLVQSYVNGTSGYRVYSDGWCEQWGRITVGLDASVSVTFLKPFMNASYYANWISCNGYTLNDEGTRACDNLTTTSMRIYNGQDCAMLANWYACGY
jgi:hypothetical protein